MNDIMSEANTTASAGPDLTESEVAGFLQAHPDFLERHPHVLAALQAHHDSGTATSLIERQVAQLRTHNQDLQARLDELTCIAEANERRVTQLNSVAQALVAATDLGELITGLDASIRREMGVDAVFIGVCTAAEHVFEISKYVHVLTEGDLCRDAVSPVFRRGKPMCAPLSESQVAALFGTQRPAPVVAASVPLGHNGVHGALVLGSTQAEHFQPDMGTLFLELLGELVTTALRRHVGADCLG